jgi:hypothetical protein
MSQARSGSGDPVIKMVLEKLFHLTQIDPSAFSPDDPLEDLGLTEQDIQGVLSQAAQALELQSSSEVLKNLKKFPQTPRQMVEWLRKLNHLNREKSA